MRGITKLIALVASLSVLAPAQDKDEAEPANAPKEPTAEEISARESGIATAWKNALGSAHQIAASQGYRRRDTRWSAALPDDGFTIIPLQLYAGNDYYVAIGTDSDSDTIAVAAFDPDKMLIKTTPDRGKGKGKLILHLSPQHSGPHYVRLRLNEKPLKPVHCALTYVYK